MRDQVVIEVSLLFIAWESGASYLDQSHSEVKQNQRNSGKISTLSLKLLERLISWVGDDSQLTRAFSPYYVCIGRHQPRPQREEDWKEKKTPNGKMKSRRVTMITASNHVFLLPSPEGLGPVKHFFHGCHSFLSRANDIFTVHDTIIHSAMLSQALEDKYLEV